MTTAPRAVDRSRAPAAFDLLRTPVLGKFLRWRHSRLAMQLPLGLVGALMIGHAFWGPDMAPKNLATLLTWVHFRGAVVLALLLGGNLFCMACPFLLPRELARRLWSPRWDWPRALRSKWPAVLLFVLVLYAYELFDLWSEPWWTGVLIVGYFGAATLVDALFRRASFCKYVCPIGQFNFVASTLSPLEVAIREPAVCATCRTHDCIRGAASAGRGREAGQRGCELLLFQPRKVGNLDCTFCMDCVYACPHDNIGVQARLPGAELTINGLRSGVGAVERRADLTLLITVFTFGALLNAFAMISPVYLLEQWLAAQTGLRVEWPILAALFVLLLVIEPALLLGAAAALSRRAAGGRTSLVSTVSQYARSLVPIGFGIWLAHYGFHFFTGAFTIVPVTQNALLHAFGRPLLGPPLWHWGGLPERVVYPMEVGFLLLGLVGSWAVGWSISRGFGRPRAWRAFAPWAAVHTLLFASALWIMSQPMEMRGTFLGG